MDPLAICGIRWVHVFEKDGADGAVYEPDSPSIPLSRRPREVMTLHADGTATIEQAGPDDRLVGQNTRWVAAAGEITLAPAGRGGSRARRRITAWSPRRLVIASD